MVKTYFLLLPHSNTLICLSHFLSIQSGTSPHRPFPQVDEIEGSGNDKWQPEVVQLLQKAMEERGWEDGKYLIDGFPRTAAGEVSRSQVAFFAAWLPFHVFRLFVGKH